MIWIIEGPDGAGKSTLVSDIRDQVDGTVFYRHQGPFATAEVMGESLDAFKDGLASGADHCPFDRLHFGEVVYGPILRGHANLSDRDAVRLNQFFRFMGARNVLCLPPWDIVRANYLSNREDQLPNDTRVLEEIYEAYKRRQQYFDVVYDYTTMEVVEAVTCA